MKKSLKVIISSVVIIAAVVAYVGPIIKMELAGSAHYTEQDNREYEFYTPEILKNMPRISTHYDFDFVNITGPAAHVYAVKFYDTDKTNQIDSYLTSKGYTRQDSCFIEAVCWRGNDPQETVTVSTLDNPQAVLVSVTNNF